MLIPAYICALVLGVAASFWFARRSNVWVSSELWEVTSPRGQLMLGVIWTALTAQILFTAWAWFFMSGSERTFQVALSILIVHLMATVAGLLFGTLVSQTSEAKHIEVMTNKPTYKAMVARERDERLEKEAAKKLARGK